MSDNEWIPVDGYKEVPKGEWLCYIPENKLMNKIQTMQKKGSGFCLVGNNFAFDLPPITHYRPLPPEPKNNK